VIWAVQVARTLTTGPSTPAPDKHATATSEAAAQVSGAKTMDVLAHPNGSKTADARIVEQPWTAQITVAPENASAKKLTSSKPSSDEQRQSLVRDLQLELKRVGCYDGEANGQWNTSSKKAMAAFTDRVNASLPYEQPDFILLTLVQGHKGRACGQDCPSGQSLAGNGRCTPNGVLAQTERKPSDSIKREAAVAAAAAAAAATLASTKLAEAKKASDRATVASSWTTTTRPAPLETGTVAAVPAPTRVIRPPQPVADTPVVTATAPVEQPARQAAPLPGRMAMGAPLPAPEAAAPLAAKPAVRPATRMAAAQGLESADHASEPVTASRQAAEPIRAAAPRVHRSAARNHTAPHFQPGPQIRRPVESVHVRRPPPAPRYFAPQQKFANSSNSSKSRRLVYEMFQRMDRN
jgi:hypothetical protein